MKRSQGIATHRDTYFLTGTKIVVKDVASFKHIDRMQGTVLELVFLNWKSLILLLEKYWLLSCMNISLCVAVQYQTKVFMTYFYAMVELVKKF